MLKGKYFYRLIWLVCISACIPIVLASIVYYQVHMQREVHQFYEQTGSSLVLIKDRVERELQRVEQESMQLAMDPLLKDSFFIPEFRDEIIYHMNILNRLSLRKNANSIIKDIVYYHADQDMLLSNKYGFMEAVHYEYVHDIERLHEIERESEWLYLPDSQSDGIVTYMRKLPVMSSGEAKGYLLFQVDAELAKSYLLEHATANETAVYVIDTQDRILFHSRNSQLHGTSLSGDPVLREIRNQTDVSSHFKLDSGNVPTFYSYLKTPFGVTYVISMPEKEISRQMGWIRGFTTLFVLCFTGLGLLLTYIVSRRAYNPIEQLVHYGQNLSNGKVGEKENDLAIIKESMDYLRGESQKLVTHLEKIEPSLRERFLQRLVDKEYLDSRTIYEECDALGIPVDRVYAVLVVKLENFYKEKRFLPDERSVATFAIKNVIQELLDHSRDMFGYAFETKEGEGAVLVHFNRSVPEAHMTKVVRQYAREIGEALETYLSFTVSVGIGRFYPHIADMPVSCGEAETALQHRLYRDDDPVIHIEDLETNERQSMFFYPRNLEQAVITALQQEDVAQAEQALNEFAHALRASKSYPLIFQSYCLLLSSIIQSLEQMSGDVLGILEHNLFGSLQQRQTTSEIYDFFIEEMFPLYQKMMGQNQATAGKSVIVQVCKYIRDNVYADLSLIQCADQVGISPSYLSRLFKKETGVSFLDYVKETKVEEAKRLLLETDSNVKTIADRIGYSERNLNRMFKQYLKMSPSQFRAANR